MRNAAGCHVVLRSFTLLAYAVALCRGRPRRLLAVLSRRLLIGYTRYRIRFRKMYSRQ